MIERFASRFVPTQALHVFDMLAMLLVFGCLLFLGGMWKVTQTSGLECLGCIERWSILQLLLPEPICSLQFLSIQAKSSKFIPIPCVSKVLLYLIACPASSLHPSYDSLPCLPGSNAPIVLAEAATSYNLDPDQLGRCRSTLALVKTCQDLDCQKNDKTISKLYIWGTPPGATIAMALTGRSCDTIWFITDKK